MSDFMRGVRAGLSGSGGMQQAARRFVLTPYLAAIEEQRARSEAARQAINEVRARTEQGNAARIDMENTVASDLLSGNARPEAFRNYNAYNAARAGKMYSNGNMPGNILSQLGEVLIANRAANEAALEKLRAESAKNRAQVARAGRSGSGSSGAGR